MKAFKKAALAAAVAALPMTGFAMEALQDEALSEVTGQDGITITLGSTGAFDIFVGDADGDVQNTPARLTGAAGGIYIEGFDTGTGNTVIEIDSDVDTIQAAITLGGGTIQLGNIHAAADENANSGGALTAATPLISMGSLTHTGITINVQLGAQDQGNFAQFTGTVSGGITLNNFAINDTVNGGSISMNVQVDDAGAGTDLTLAGALNVDANGLQLTGLPNVDVVLGALDVGGAAAIGDVHIIGLTTPNITIAGH